MNTPADMSFADLGLAAALLRAVEDVGYEAPTPIQAACIPPLREGRDLLGQAQTGTGKTAAFALPLLGRVELGRAEPQLLVLTPTRELALQVAEAMQSYARHLRGLHVLPVYGGQSMETQLRRLRRGVHVVVGTPGRILDHLRRATLRLERLSAVVLDEADEMLRMGFIDDVEAILDATPESRQLALFSATLPAPIRKVAERHLHDPVTIRIETSTATVEATRQRWLQVSHHHKLDALTRILAVEEFDAMLIFVRTRQTTAELADKLEARGFASAPLSGEMSQHQRERTVERVRGGKLDIVVATDVAARGLDVERVSHVVNYDSPYDVEAYVHPILRTGRAGRSGEAILFLTPRERRLLRVIEQATGQRIEPMRLPSSADISDRRVAQFKDRIREVIESEELGFFEELVTSYETEHDIEAREIAAALAFLVQQEQPLKPEAAVPPPPDRPARERAPRAERRERAPRSERPERGEPAARRERPPRGERPARAARGPEPGMERFRVELGREHGVEPKHLVGAIANEAELPGQFIGPVVIHESYSTIDLPEDMPRALEKHLRKVWVLGRQLGLRREAEAAGAPRVRAERGRGRDAGRGGGRSAAGTRAVRGSGPEPGSAKAGARREKRAVSRGKRGADAGGVKRKPSTGGKRKARRGE